MTLFWDKLLVFMEALGGVSDMAEVVYEEKSFKCIRFNNDSCTQYSCAIDMSHGGNHVVVM